MEQRLYLHEEDEDISFEVGKWQKILDFGRVLCVFSVMGFTWPAFCSFFFLLIFGRRGFFDENLGEEVDVAIVEHFLKKKKNLVDFFGARGWVEKKKMFSFITVIILKFLK